MHRRAGVTSVYVGSGYYEFRSEDMDKVMTEYAHRDITQLQREINDRVIGIPEGDDTYRCELISRFELLTILASFEYVD